LLRPEASAATLIIQSRHPGRPALQALAADAPSRFYDEELAQRKELGYPPFSRLAVLRLSGGAAALRRDQADRLVRQARPRLETLPEPRAELWGPVSAPLKGRDGWELLLKAPTPATLHRALAAIRRLPLAVQLEAQNALQIEVDPA
jgi:primosomal protein N' (replication factor Y)